MEKISAYLPVFNIGSCFVFLFFRSSHDYSSGTCGLQSRAHYPAGAVGKGTWQWPGHGPYPYQVRVKFKTETLDCHAHMQIQTSSKRGKSECEAHVGTFLLEYDFEACFFLLLLFS